MKKGNLYYYFKNKEEILFACHQYSLDRLLQLLDEVAAERASRRRRSCGRSSSPCVHTILDELHGTALILELEALSPAHLEDGHRPPRSRSIAEFGRCSRKASPTGRSRRTTSSCDRSRCSER